MKIDRIAVIGKSNYLHWDKHVVDAFTDLGYSVKHFQVNSRPMHVQLVRGAAKGVLGKNLASKLSDAWHASIVLKQLQDFRPDVIFYVSYMFIPLEYYEIVHKLPVKPIVIGWDGDLGPSYDSNKKYVPFMDILFEAESYYCENNPHGYTNIVHLPFAVNPNVHKNHFNQRENKIYFCGAWTPERDVIFSQLTEFPVVLKGWNWHKLSRVGKKYEIANGTVAIGDLIKDYNKYNIVINKHQNFDNIKSLNMRSYEVPACGALLLTDSRPDMQLFYTENEEIAVYRAVDELGTICDRLLSSPADIYKMADKAYERTLREHTYKNRMQTVLDSISSICYR